MTDYSRLRKLDAQFKELKRAKNGADVTAILLTALRDTDDLEEKLYILSRLTSEYQLLGKLEEAEAALRQQIELEPNNPEAWLVLAAHYFRYVRDSPRAFWTVELAVQKALQERNFVRQAYAERIRIALEMKNYTAVEDSLVQLIDYMPEPGSIDVELENDFLPRIPASEVRRDLLERYKKLARRLA